MSSNHRPGTNNSKHESYPCILSQVSMMWTTGHKYGAMINWLAIQ